MELIEINPYVRSAVRHHTYDQRNATHCSYDARLFALSKGNGFAMISGKRYNVKKGTAVYIPPACEYLFSFDKQDDFTLYIIDFDFITYFLKQKVALSSPLADFEPENVPQYNLPAQFKDEIIWENCPIIDTVEHIIDYKLQGSMCSNELCSAEMKFFLVNMLVMSNPQNIPGRQNNVNEIISYIHTHYSDSSVSCASIASMFGYHPNYLTRIFKQVTGKTLKQYILYYRIKIAKEILATSKYDIGEVAWRVGFNSSSHFIASFRAETGVTPRVYRIKSRDNEPSNANKTI